MPGPSYNPKPFTSALSKGLEVAQKPLMPKSAIAGLQQGMDPGGSDPEGGFFDAARAIPDVARGMWNNPRETMGGMGAGLLEGARQQTSPLNIANAAATGYAAAPMLARGGKLALNGLKGAMAPAGKAAEGWGMRMGGEAVEAAAPKAAAEAGSIPQAHPKMFNAKETLDEFNKGKLARDMAARDAIRGTAADVAHSPQAQALEKIRTNGGINWGPEQAAATAASEAALPAAANAIRQPKVGGVLYDVLERGGLKQGLGQANTPGELGLMKRFAPR